MSVHLTFLIIINLTPIFCFLSHSLQIFHHILRQNYLTPIFISSLTLSQIHQILRQKKYLFVTAFLPPNADAHFLCFCSGSERGSYAIFGFEAFFSARHRSRSTRPVEERHVLRSSRTLFLSSSSRTLFLSSVHPNGLRFPWTLGTLFPGDIQTRTRTSPSPPWNNVPW